MRAVIVYIATCALLFSIFSCNAPPSLAILSLEEGKTTVIKNVVDMKGEELLLPNDVILKSKKGGYLKNGKISAANTSIVGYRYGIFEGVNIAGQWNVKYISTDMFKDIPSVNSLQTVLKRGSLQKGTAYTWCRPDDKYFRIRSGMPIGEGMWIAHPYSTILNAEGIGKNFRCIHCTTLGAGKNGIPTLGDNVSLGANVVIVGGVKIGNNVTIGAGSVVVKDIPDNSVAVGNPAKVIKTLSPIE